MVGKKADELPKTALQKSRSDAVYLVANVCLLRTANKIGINVLLPKSAVKPIERNFGRGDRIREGGSH